MDTPEPIDVEGMLIKPHNLHDFVLAGCALPRKEALVHQRHPIVRSRTTLGYAADGLFFGWAGPIHRM